MLAKLRRLSWPERSTDNNWQQIFERRYREIKEGRVQAISSEEVFRRARGRRT